jgi:hypothetical protein
MKKIAARFASYKLCRSPSTALRTEDFDTIEDLPFMLRLLKHSEPLFNNPLI